MTIIADGGATRTSWCRIQVDKEPELFETSGYHPFYIKAAEMTASLRTSLPPAILADREQVKELFFYSAGGGYAAETDAVLINGLSAVFTNAGISIETDLLAAARALLHRQQGMAAILGTGSNSCLYDGKKIIANIESLGFLLGDEGSGAYIGKKVIGDFIRDRMPPQLRNQFETACGLSAVDLLTKVYTEPEANKYCAGFARFLKEHITDAYCSAIVVAAFHDFFTNIVDHYPEATSFSFNALGSVAFHFKEQLQMVAEEHGFQVGAVLPAAIGGLIAFHNETLTEES
ncbi:N-acetylglucosamine kinase [Niabella beijingensis]|uniref:N-acetylglucosamine kinase n=1 Tax=Niabella beijingensis TaxID=2872700 RepID=UPI001CBEB958|nr:N-acetylglucosamine kinase [Niabella beijingensis]MBZ4188864.1 N-acetylglucosamine kinase [Niabella beijingensis]